MYVCVRMCLLLVIVVIRKKSNNKISFRRFKFIHVNIHLSYICISTEQTHAQKRILLEIRRENRNLSRQHTKLRKRMST